MVGIADGGTFVEMYAKEFMQFMESQMKIGPVSKVF